MSAVRCAIYTRVSTDAQERDGTSLDTQERACREHADQHGWIVVETIRDTASGFRLDRPGLERLRRMVREGTVDVVLAYALDRLSRKQTHVAILVEEVEECGERLAFVTESFEETATGQLLRSVKAFAAEFEREKIAERTMRGKAERARSGRMPQGTGKGMYGYRYDAETGRRAIVPEQAAVVRGLFEEFCAGASCHGLAVRLNERNVPAFGGGGWHALTVRRVLRNESYTGRTIYRRTRAEQVRSPQTGKRQRQVVERDVAEWIEVAGATPVIVAPGTFAQAVAILADPARRLRGQPSREYRLRGHVRCLACGTPMVGQALLGGRYTYYRCRRSYGGKTDGVCQSRYVKVELLERVVREEIANVLCDPERLLVEAQRLAGADPDAIQRVEIARRVEQVIEQQRKLAQLYLTGSVPEDVLAEQGEGLKRERVRLEREQAALRSSSGMTLDLARLRRDLPAALARLHTWVLEAGDHDLALLLRALQVEVAASREEVRISGVIPGEPRLERHGDQADLVTIVQTSA